MTNTEPELITTERVLDLLDEAVRERGADFTYPGRGPDCVYFVDDNVLEDFTEEGIDVEVGSPACIVGFVLSKLGVKAEDLGAMNTNTGAGSLLGNHFRDRFEFEQGAVEALEGAQVEQDTGATWGQARDFARNHARDYA